MPHTAIWLWDLYLWFILVSNKFAILAFSCYMSILHDTYCGTVVIRAMAMLSRIHNALVYIQPILRGQEDIKEHLSSPCIGYRVCDVILLVIKTL